VAVSFEDKAMRMSEWFGRTLRERPAGGGAIDAWAQRAGYEIHTPQGVVYTPLAARMLHRLTEEHEAALAGTQPMYTGLDSPLLWIAAISRVVRSYRQLPVNLCGKGQLSGFDLTGGDSGALSGLVWIYAGGAEEAARAQSERWVEAMQALWSAHSLTPRRAHALGDAYSFYHATEQGEQVYLVCAACDYYAEQSAATRAPPVEAAEVLENLEKIATPGAETIEALTASLAVEAARTLKSVLLTSPEGELILALLPGDRELNPEKLRAILRVTDLKPASDAIIRAHGLEPGYAGPVGLSTRAPGGGADVLVVADPAVERGANFISGANEAGYHWSGVNYPRDFEVSMLADITLAVGGDPCPSCGLRLDLERGIKFGVVTVHPDAFQFADAEDRQRDGSLFHARVALDRVLTAVFAAHRVEDGFAFSVRSAPCAVYLVDLRASEQADSAYQDLLEAGISVLYDDRLTSAGIKFTDADWIGCPLRITISRRSLAGGGAEISARGGAQAEIVPLARLPTAVNQRLSTIM
jgi:prolyl-tRNA editing enzyme YbaK/EbsC (Cys-tRNA(Pro) deacylase)